MRLPATVRWVGLALLGIVVAVAVAVAASRLASQRIGLASEPISAGDALAPAAAQPRAGPRRRHGQAKPPAATTPPATTATPPPATTTAPPPPAPEAVAPEPRPEGTRHRGGDGEHGGQRGGHADD